MITSSYIHIPFCSNKCKYCGFTSFINLKLKSEYTNKLLEQIEKSYDKTPQKTLYIGGGTPSLLSLEQVSLIVKKFNFEKDYELTFEVNPENANYDYFKGLLDIGVNRLSIGVQTFDDEILSEIGRRHSSKEAIRTFEIAYGAGFKNVSADLIYGLPNQNAEKLKQDLNITRQLNIPHISTYGLKIEEGTFYNRFAPKNLPDEEVQADFYKLIKEELCDFEHYEISNFAKNKNYFSRHNLNYWNVGTYGAYGVGASGFDGYVRYKNTENLKKYLENPFLREEEIESDKDALLEERIFLGFRKKEGIDKTKINNEFGIDFDEKFKHQLKKYLESGHLKKTETGYALTFDGVLISNYILCDFLC